MIPQHATQDSGGRLVEFSHADTHSLSQFPIVQDNCRTLVKAIIFMSLNPDNCDSSSSHYMMASDLLCPDHVRRSGHEQRLDRTGDAKQPPILVPFADNHQAYRGIAGSMNRN